MSQQASTLAPERTVSSGNVVQVTITLDLAAGQVSCSPNPVRVKPGHTVQWSCDDGPWAVMPVGLSPFDVRIIRGERGKATGEKPSAKAPFGRYEYVVAVEKNGEIYLEDPEIIFGPK